MKHTFSGLLTAQLFRGGSRFAMHSRAVSDWSLYAFGGYGRLSVSVLFMRKRASVKVFNTVSYKPFVGISANFELRCSCNKDETVRC